MLGRLAVVALAGAIVFGGLAAGFALSDDDGSADGRFGVIDLAKNEDEVGVTTIDDDGAPDGDGTARRRQLQRRGKLGLSPLRPEGPRRHSGPSGTHVPQ